MRDLPNWPSEGFAAPRYQQADQVKFGGFAGFPRTDVGPVVEDELPHLCLVDRVKPHISRGCMEQLSWWLAVSVPWLFAGSTT